MPRFNDFPFDEVLKVANEKIAQGWTICQKFTCAGCGQRLTMGTPNVFYETGTCDRCPTVTNIRARGCNYMAMMSDDPRQSRDLIREAAAEGDRRQKERTH